MIAGAACKEPVKQNKAQENGKSADDMRSTHGLDRNHGRGLVQALSQNGNKPMKGGWLWLMYVDPTFSSEKSRAGMAGADATTPRT